MTWQRYLARHHDPRRHHRPTVTTGWPATSAQWRFRRPGKPAHWRIRMGTKPLVVTWAVARSPSCKSGVQEVPLPEYACAVGAAFRSTTTSLLRRPFSRAFSTSST